MEDGHQVRVRVAVAHLLADELKGLAGTFGVDVYLPRQVSCQRVPSH